MDFQHGGVVRHLRPTDTFLVGEVPGKTAMVISDVHAGDVLVYFERSRRPKVGTRIGAVGHWVCMKEPLTLENSPPGFPVFPGASRVEHQLHVLAWQRISESFDWILDCA